MKPWPTVRLSEVLRERRETPSTDDLAFGRVRIVSKISFDKGRIELRTETDTNTGMILARPGDLVISGINAAKGAIAIYGPEHSDPIAATIHYGAYTPKSDRADLKFLWWFFRSRFFRDLLNEHVPGGIKTELKSKRLFAIPIPLPPLAEQRRVVVRIEELAAQIHEARTLRHQTTEETKALIPRATTWLLDKAAWPTSALGEILAEKPRNGLGPQREVDSGGRAMLRINAVSSSTTRFVDMSAAKRVDVADNVAEQFVVQHDDVLIVRYNSDINRVAKPAIYKGANDQRAVYPDKLIRLRPDPTKMTPDFLVFALSSRSVRAQIEELGKTTAGNIGVSGGDAKSFLVPVPALPDQRRIVSELDALQGEVDTLKGLQAETAAELDALLAAILDKAFKGEL